MLKRIAFLVFIPAILLFQSCKNEIDINADWKDVTVVFGLLNQNDNIHFVRVSRAFLGEGNALTYAQVFDSLYYENVKVSMEEYINGNLNRTIQLRDTFGIPKEPGIFHYPDQKLYYTTASLNPQAEYKLLVKNEQTGNLTYATTSLVNGFQFTKPLPTENVFGWLPLTVAYPFGWKTAANGRLYEFIIRFNYGEKSLEAPFDSVGKFVDWNLGRQRSEFLFQNADMGLNVENIRFYQFLSVAIPEFNGNVPEQNVERTVGRMELIMNIASDDFTTFLDVNQPSNTIVQERPKYTNVVNGIGLFASRFNFRRQNIAISVFTIDEIKNNELTAKLNFVR